MPNDNNNEPKKANVMQVMDLDKITQLHAAALEVLDLLTEKHQLNVYDTVSTLYILQAVIERTMGVRLVGSDYTQALDAMEKLRDHNKGTA